MTEKFKDKYTIKSSRLQNYDYSQNGMYFVTICTKDREHLFGEVENGKIILNRVGKIINEFWQDIPKYFSFVNVDVYQIMPNHLHGILEINKTENVEARFQKEFVEARFIATEGRDDSQDSLSPQDTLKTIPQDAMNRVSTGNANKKPGGVTGEDNPMLNPGSLANIVRWYKGRCSFEIRKRLNPITFAWQSRFYDHVIRKDESLQKIREYIQGNPRMWERDRNNVENIWM